MPATRDREFEPRVCLGCRKMVFACPTFTALPVYCAECVHDDTWSEEAFAFCSCCGEFMSDLTPGHSIHFHLSDSPPESASVFH
jgi:hypothetical protein